jgi:meso-butanediol dehydrogenase/(S,S)-butanediol dehydrogenase/diacetyl reductase
MLLDDKVVILTGGSSGIGHKCAIAYAREGARLALLSNKHEDIEKVLAELEGDTHIGIDCDVSDEQQISAAIKKTIQHYGRINAIHNNAGIVVPSKVLHETTTDEWNRLMNINLKSIYLTTKFGFESLRATRGTILNTSSLVADIGQQDHAAYAATKGGINALTKSMALDYARYGIRVNAVCPAWVWTPAVQAWINQQSNELEVKKYIDNIHPLGYCPEGDVVADASVFLLSEKARFITGCTLPVSGGAELGYRR